MKPDPQPGFPAPDQERARFGSLPQIPYSPKLTITGQKVVAFVFPLW